MSSLPLYVSDRGHGEFCFPAPAAINGVTGRGFLIPADARALANFLGSQMNLPGSPASYTPLGPFVLNVYLEAQSVSPTTETIGYIPDRECAFMVPVIESITQGGVVSRKLKIWVPYIFINQGSGMVTGREVWGWRKTMADIHIDMPASGLPAYFGVETLLFKKFAPGARGVVRPLLQLSGTPCKQKARAAQPWTTHEQAARGIFKAASAVLDAAAAAALKPLMDQLAKVPVIPVVNLKQFRDAVDGTRACYQALVDSPCQLTALRSVKLLLDWSFSLGITGCESHQIVSDLGLPALPDANGDYTVPVLLGGEIDMDFTALAGNLVWQAS